MNQSTTSTTSYQTSCRPVSLKPYKTDVAVLLILHQRIQHLGMGFGRRVVDTWDADYSWLVDSIEDAAHRKVDWDGYFQGLHRQCRRHRATGCLFTTKPCFWASMLLNGLAAMPVKKPNHQTSAHWRHTIRPVSRPCSADCAVMVHG